MAFLGVKELIELQHDYVVINPFQEDRVKNGSYELSLGKEVYLTDSQTGKIEILNEDANRCIDINPGQFALLLTKEKINIPKNKIAFISVKAGEKLKGLINVSGFHVDPGFNDHLLFSVYNAGPSTIVLNFDEPYFPIWFAELKTELKNEEAYNNNNEHFGKLQHIPNKYVEFLKRGELTSPKALQDKIKEVESNLNEKIVLINEKKDRNEWLYKIAIGLFIAILLKVAWDRIAYNSGYDDGKSFKTINEQIINEVKKKNIDSIVSIRVDSIINKRFNDGKNEKR